MQEENFTIEKWKYFYTGAGRLPNGMNLSDCFNFEFSERENDFFKWLFPIDSGNGDAGEIPIFESEMIYFMGLNRSASVHLRAAVDAFQLYLRSSRNWSVHARLNCKRISRVLKCLRLFGQFEKLYQFYSFILKMHNRISSPNSYDQICAEYWRTATFGKALFCFFPTLNDLEQFKRAGRAVLPDHRIFHLTWEMVIRVMRLREPVFTLFLAQVFPPNLSYPDWKLLIPVDSFLSGEDPKFLRTFRHKY